jgi:hypothetical protein
MAKYSMKVKGKEIGPAELYAPLTLWMVSYERYYLHQN